MANNKPDNELVELFDYSKYQNITERVRIRLRRKDEIIPSPWEVGNLVDNFSNGYYKVELLNTIALLLQNNFSPRNIFILDQSFKVFNSNSIPEKIILDNISIKYLYTIGKPVSMFPNIKIYMLSLIFQAFRSCNEKLHTYRSRRINRNTIASFAKDLFYLDREFNLVIEDIIKMAVLQIKDPLKSQIEAFYKIKDNIIKSYNQYLVDEIFMPQIEEMINSLKEPKLTEEQERIFNTYYNKFYHLINKISRPIICLFHEESKCIQILGISHVNKNKRNTNFLDIKNISHNSNLIADFIFGAANGVTTVYKTVNDEKRSKELHELNVKNAELDIKIKEAMLQKIETENLISQQKLIQEKITTHTMINEMAEKYVTNNNPKIDNLFLRRQALNSYNNVLSSNKQLLSVNKMEIIEIKKEE